MNDDPQIDIEPSFILFGPSDSEKRVHLHNHTLNYISFIVVHPNPALFEISPESGKFIFKQGIIDPCSSLEVVLKARILGSFNYNCFVNNPQLVVFTHDQYDENDQVHWNISPDLIQKHTIKLDYVSEDLKRIVIPSKTIVAQKHKGIYSEEEKKLVVSFCLNRNGRTENYSVTNSMAFFSYNHTLLGDAFIIENNNSYFILLIYVPCQIIHAFNKYQIEPMSPQQVKKIAIEQVKIPTLETIKKNKKQKEEAAQQPVIEQEQQQQIQTQATNQSPVLQPEVPQEEVIQQKPRYYQSEVIQKQDFLEFQNPPKKQSKPKQQSQIKEKTPIQIESQKQTQTESSPLQPNFRRVAIFNAYQQIKQVLLFRDNSYLISVSDKEIIKVWSLSMNAEVGILHEHTEIKKVTIVSLHEWQNEDDRQFLTQGSDGVIRVFSITAMAQKSELKVNEFSELTALAMLPDKEQLCLAGTPKSEFTLFGSGIPKFRYLKLFNLALKEVLQYKIPTESGQILSPVVYTDNDNVNHARLNNVLVVSKTRRDKPGGEVLFLMIDMNDLISVIMTLDCQQLNIYSIKDIFYLPLRGSFVILERSDAKGYQQSKILVVNVKQLQTEHGLQNGIVCNQFDEPSIIDDQVFVLPKMELIVKISGDMVQLINLKTNNQQNLQISNQIGGSPKNVIMAGKIIRIDGEIIQILELQS